MPRPSVKKHEETASRGLIWPNGLAHGLARVVRQASLSSDAWAGWKESHLEAVSELPLGTLAICLPPIKSDAGWASVMAVLNDDVCHTYVHPESLAPIGCVSHAPVLTVGCARNRGRQLATHPEVRSASHSHGIHFAKALGGEFGLDARWHERSQRLGSCTGRCCSVAAESFSFAERLRDLMDLADLAYLGKSNCWIVCDRATHRSLGSAFLLMHLCHLDLELTFASTRLCQCGSPTSLIGLAAVARNSPAPPLSYSLWSRVCHARVGYFMPPPSAQLALPRESVLADAMAGYCGRDASTPHRNCVWPAAAFAGLAHDHAVSERAVPGDEGWYCSRLECDVATQRPNYANRYICRKCGAPRPVSFPS
jgi:hypothetical protein